MASTRNADRPSISAKAVAALQAFAAGDALGWPMEMSDRYRSTERSLAFRTWQRKSGGRFRPFVETIEAGHYSDDTQLTFAVGRALLCGDDWRECLSQRELPLFPLYQRGAGRSVLRACASWRRGTAPWLTSNAEDIRGYFETGANGAAMRVLPHAIWNAATHSDESPNRLAQDVFDNSILTHGHARAHVGAVLYAFAAFELLRTRETLAFGHLIELLQRNVEAWGQIPVRIPESWLTAHEKQQGPYASVWKQTVQESIALLSTARNALANAALADDMDVLRRLGCLGKMKGSGTATTVGAVYLASRYAAQPRAGVLMAAYADDADTDTLAAMTGGLLGALAGKAWMPSEWDTLQDRDALDRLASRLTDHATHITEWKRATESSMHELFDRLERPDADPSVSIDAGLTGTVLERDTKTEQKGRLINTWTIRWSDGQTIFLRKTHDRPSSDTKAARKELSSASRTGAHRSIVSCIRIPVRSISEMLAFYEQGLGLEPVRETEHVVSFGALVLTMDPGDWEGLLRTAPSRAIVAIEVSDFDVFLERLSRLRAHEVSRSSDDVEQRWVKYRDPEGNLVELRERGAKRTK